MNFDKGSRKKIVFCEMIMGKEEGGGEIERIVNLVKWSREKKCEIKELSLIEKCC